MGKRAGVSCCIVDQHCLAPAGYGISGSGRYGVNPNLPASLPSCEACERPVCTNCTYDFKGQKVCRECFEDMGGAEARLEVRTRAYDLAGYEEPRLLAQMEMA